MEIEAGQSNKLVSSPDIPFPTIDYGNEERPLPQSGRLLAQRRDGDLIGAGGKACFKIQLHMHHECRVTRMGTLSSVCCRRMKDRKQLDSHSARISCNILRRPNRQLIILLTMQAVITKSKARLNSAWFCREPCIVLLHWIYSHPITSSRRTVDFRGTKRTSKSRPPAPLELGCFW